MHIHTLSLGPSTASDADMLYYQSSVYPALIDSGNGLIRKAGDGMNHSLLQAWSLGPSQRDGISKKQPARRPEQHQRDTSCSPP